MRQANIEPYRWTEIQEDAPNWMSTMTKKASGTWSSEREEVMSAAAECFWRDKKKKKKKKTSGLETQRTKHLSVIHHQWKMLHPEGPEAEDDDDEVDGVSQEHEDVDVSDGAVLRLDQSPEEVQYWSVEGRPPEPQRHHN